MIPEPSDPLQRWSRAWDTAARFLRRERLERLAAMSDDDARAAIAAIFSGPAAQDGGERPTGLIEQQRLFRGLK